MRGLLLRRLSLAAGNTASFLVGRCSCYTIGTCQRRPFSSTAIGRRIRCRVCGGPCPRAACGLCCRAAVRVHAAAAPGAAAVGGVRRVASILL